MADLGVFINISAQDAASASIGKVGDAIDHLGRNVDQATRPLQSFTDLMAGGLGIAVGMKALDGLLDAFGGIKGAAIDLTANLERTQVALANLFQSPEQAAGMVAALKQLAATTPFYTQTLTAATQELSAMGIATNQILPLLRDIGTVAAASGGDTQQAFKRITLAVGELNTEQTAYTRQLNQLAIAGVPIFEELSNELGVTTGQIREMTKQGALSSDTVINALHNLANSPRYGDMLAQQAQTFNGSLTTIKDNIAFLISDAFEPLFKVIETGVVGFANLTKTDAWQAWGQAAHTAVQGLLDALTPLAQALAPAIAGVQQMVQTLTETGNVSTALAQLKDGVGQSLQTILAGITAFGRQLFGAGVDLITTFADGMLSAGGAVLTSTVTSIADTIAGFLIGHSPPANGPLNQIAVGGRTLMETYGQGMQQGLDPVRQAVAGVSTELQNAGTNLGALKSIGLEVEGQIHAVARAAHEIDSEIQATKNSIQDIKDSYQAQLAPLEEQHHQLTAQRDTSLEMAQLANQLEGTQLRQAEALARGDSEQRAILSAQVQTYQAVEQEASLREQLITTQQKLDDLGTASLRQQEQRNQLAEQEVALRDRIAKDAVPDPRFGEQIASTQQRIAQLQQPDLGYENRSQELANQLAQLQGGGGAQAQLEALRQRQQQAQLTNQLRNARGPGAAQQRQQATVGLEELRLQQQAAAEQKQQQIERVQQQQAALEKEKAAADARRAQEIADAQRRIGDLQREAAAALERQRKDAEAAAAQLVSLDLRRQALDKQEGQEAAILQARQDQLEARQAEIGTQLELAGMVDTDQLAQITQQEAINRAHEDTFNWLKQQDDAQRKMLDLPILAAISALKDEEAARLAPLNANLEVYTRQKQAVTDQHTAWEEVKADLIQAEAEAHAVEAANKAAAKAVGVGQGLTVGEIDPAAQLAAQEHATEAGQKLAAALGEGMQTWLQMHAGDLIGGALGVAIGSIAFGPIGAVAGAALGAAIGQQLQETFAAQDIDFASTLQARMGEAADVLGTIFDTLHGAWDTLVDALTQIGAFDDLREAWNLLATDVGPKLSDLLGGMGPLMQTLATIAGEVLVLAIKGVTESVLLTIKAWDAMVSMAKLVGDAFNGLSGVMQAASATLTKAWSEDWGGIRTAVETVVTWFTETALPAITTFLTTGATQIQTFATNVAEFFRKGIAQWQAVFTTDLGTLGTNVVTQITKVGGDIVAGLSKGITDKWEGFKTGLGNQLQDLVTFLRGPQGIDAHSPSQLFSAMVGEPIGEGIMAGAETAVAAGIPALVAQTQSMVDTLGAITQAARDKAVADAREAQAAAMAGIAAVQELAQAVGGSAYPSGGLPQAPGVLPGGAGATGTGGILLGLGGGPNIGTGLTAGGGSSGTGGHAVGGGSGGSGGTTGSGLEAWHISAPGLNPTQIYGNSAPGYGPIITQPTTTSLFGGPGSAPSGGLAPTGPPANLWNPYANPPPGWTVDEWYNWLNGTGPSAPAADTAGGGKAPLIVNQTISVTGTSPDELIRQNDLWLDRAQWQAGIG